MAGGPKTLGQKKSLFNVKETQIHFDGNNAYDRTLYEINNDSRINLRRAADSSPKEELIRSLFNGKETRKNQLAFERLRITVSVPITVILSWSGPETGALKVPPCSSRTKTKRLVFMPDILCFCNKRHKLEFL